MISWMQTNLEKHYRWLFSILLVIIVIAFVFTIGASPGIGSGRKVKPLNYYGYDLNNPDVQQDLRKKTEISLLLNATNPLLMQTMIERNFLARPVLLHLADEHQVPTPNEAELKKYIESRPYFSGPNGEFNQLAYKNFVALLKDNPQVNEEDAKTTLVEDFRIERVMQDIKGPSYTTDYEAKLAYGLEHAKLNLNVGVWESKSGITDGVSDEDLQTYYDEVKLSYIEPKQVVVKTVLFPYDNFIGAVKTPSDEELENFFDRSLAQLIRQDAETFSNKEFSEVKSKLMEHYKAEQAKRLAGEQANDFLYQIYEQQVTLGSDKLEALYETYNLKPRKLKPYSEKSMPVTKSFPSELLRQGLSLNEEQFYSEPALTDKGALVALYDAVLPSRIPELSEIRGQILEAYKKFKQDEFFANKAKYLVTTTSSALSKGSSFEAIAKEQGFQLEQFKDISLAKLPELLKTEDSFPRISKLREGEVTTLAKDDKLLVVHLKDRVSPQIDDQDENFIRFRGKLERIASTVLLESFLEEMMKAELETQQN